MLRHIEEGRHSSDAPYFPDENFPLAPDAVRNAYRTYWQSTQDRPAAIASREHELVLVNTLISDFCDEYIQPAVYSAAMLAPIADDLQHPERKHAAMAALRIYTLDPNEPPESTWFVLGILSDRQLVRDFWSEETAKIHAQTPELLAELQQTENHIIETRDIWNLPPKLIVPDHIHTLLDSVNLESLLIQSAEALEFLDSARATNDSVTLQWIHKAESLLAPLCETIGFDGLAMALHSRTNVLRAEFTGNTAPLERARQVIGERGDEQQVDQDVQALFSTIFGDHIHEQVIKHAAPHGVVIGEGLCTEDNLRVVWRLKSVGSLTNKLIRENNPEHLPLDILGATIVADDEAQLAKQLARIIDRSHTDPQHIKLTPTYERTDPVHVKGTPEYIDTMRVGLGFGSLDSMRRFVDIVEVPEGGHRVCKVTLVHHYDHRPELRAEIQLTTKKDRVEARIGSAAHLLYKFAASSKELIDPSYLAAIRERKASLNYIGLIAASHTRAGELYEQITSTT